MPPSYDLSYVWRVCLVAALGGLLFGYDWVVIGGAKPFFVPYFGLEERPNLVGWAMSSALVGCMAGALISGLLSDRFGRKKLLILAGFLFTVSAVGTAVAGAFDTFVGYRLLGGLGIGLASNLSPMYIGEMSPAEMRGRLVSINQLTIVIGVLLAQVVNWAIASGLTDDLTTPQMLTSWYGRWGWRWMFGAETVPAVLFFGAMFSVPESPRWLVKNGRNERARAILTRIGGRTYASAELEAIRRTLDEREVGAVRFGDLLRPGLLRIIVLGAFLAALQQWCGINVIFYYAEDVFRAAGYSVSGTMLNIVYTGVINLAFTFVAIATVDRWGRRPLMLLGCVALAVLYAFIGTGYHLDTRGVPMLVMLLAAIAVYAFTLAPVTWVLLAELFPNRIRGAAMSAAVFTLWVTCWALAQVFPVMNAWLGARGSFWLFGAICLVGFVTLYRTLPETRGKSLEDIEGSLGS